MAAWVFLGAVLAFLVTTAAGLFRIRARRMARARAGESFRHFAAHFGGQGIETEVLLAVYRYFQHRMRWDVEGFPVRASDEIAGVYGIVDDELDDAIEELLAGRELPTPTTVLPRMRTVEDLVRLVASRPRTDEQRPPYQGRCPGCGYDLTGNASSVCPECGAALAS
jgi:hypothetical protein